jgi:preprotein translocase subunit SecD
MSSRTRGWLILIVILTVAVVYVNASSELPFGGRNIDPKLGLDLSGGTQVLLEASPAPGQTLDQVTMGQARQIVENRVNAFGLTEPLVQLAGGNRILVELPAEKDPARAVSTIQQTGRLEFVEVGQQFYPAGEIIRTQLSPTPTNVLTPTQTITSELGVLAPTATPGITDTGSITTTEGVNSLEAQFGPVYPTLFTGAELKPEALRLTTSQLGAPSVAFELASDAAQRFATYTAANIGGYLCIVLDNRVNSCPRINSAIPDGKGIIEMGSGAADEAQSLLTLLRYGALPVSLTVVQSRTIGPTLGTESINNSVKAGIIGLAAVAVFMILYYRLTGAIAVLALFLYALTVFALFKLIPVTLTLPGIGGFILSIGVAVDANVLIFERMKEELRAGRSVPVAVDVGFERAWPSIRDSNISTLITCGILFWFGNAFGASIVKGFAITLALGVAVSLFTAIRVTRTLLHLIIDRADFEKRHGLLGVR